MIPILSHYQARRACDQYLRAVARLIASESYQDYTARAYEGVHIEWQATRLREVLNRVARSAETTMQSFTSDVGQDLWYVDIIAGADGAAPLLHCRYDQWVGIGSGWTIHT